jgi:hypothetical protein
VAAIVPGRVDGKTTSQNLEIWKLEKNSSCNGTCGPAAGARHQ